VSGDGWRILIRIYKSDTVREIPCPILYWAILRIAINSHVGVAAAAIKDINPDAIAAFDILPSLMYA